MINRASRTLMTMLSLILAGVVSAQAGPMPISQVLQALGNTQNGSGTSQGRSSSTYATTTIDSQTASIAQNPASIVSGTTIPQQGPGNVETVEQGDVTGTVCDCGEIRIPGKFPLWPLFGLGAIPLFFIHNDTPPNDVFPTPTPPPPPPPPSSTPEPASLLLFGTGLAALGAGARRRYGRGKARKQLATPTEV